MSDYEEKKEFPTDKKLKKAKKQGMNTYSKELNSFIIILVFFFLFFIFRKFIFFNIINIFISNFSFDYNIVNKNSLLIIKNIFFSEKKFFIFIFLFLFILFLTSFFSPVVSKNFSLNFKMIHFNFNHLNLLQGIKKIFSYNIFIDLIKIVWKILFLFIFFLFFTYFYFFKNFYLLYESFYFCLLNSLYLIFVFFIFSLISFIPSVIFDIFWSNYLFYKKLKMNNKELKEELKRSEGDPEIKIKIREKLRLILKENSISELHLSDVVISDFKDYSVSLKYNYNCMVAPKIISKGAGLHSLKMLKFAKKFDIPIFESFTLSKVLYKEGEVGKYVPGIFYSVIAEVFAWVLKLKKWKKEGGKYPKPPKYLCASSNSNILGKN
ncbi:Flagellar biosynthetic protein FlhB [Buchnera aphidicola (Periphyllus testudinaceus)]|uniref:EscU/YscU/HrcU family type III secretion system export apparatus switch protein n=1 Tax=Buchnera aphidicola TaxID=9 RepID=UPI003463F07B